MRCRLRRGSGASRTSWACRSSSTSATRVDAATLDGVFEWLRWVDATFSTYTRRQRDQPAGPRRAGSPRRAPGSPRVLAAATPLRVEQPAASFDRRVRPLGPTRSGLVKGWAVDRAAAILVDAGPAQLRDQRRRRHPRRGARVPEPGWRVGIQHPLEREALPPSSKPAISRSRPRVPTSVATTSSIRTYRPARRPECWPSPITGPRARKPPMRTRRPRSRWGNAGVNWSARHSPATRR